MHNDEANIREKVMYLFCICIYLFICKKCKKKKIKNKGNVKEVVIQITTENTKETYLIPRTKFPVAV